MVLGEWGVWVVSWLPSARNLGIENECGAGFIRKDKRFGRQKSYCDAFLQRSSVGFGIFRHGTATLVVFILNSTKGSKTRYEET